MFAEAGAQSPVQPPWQGSRDPEDIVMALDGGLGKSAHHGEGEAGPRPPGEAAEMLTSCRPVCSFFPQPSPPSARELLSLRGSSWESG